jgi:hypothetical protein
VSARGEELEGVTYADVHESARTPHRFWNLGKTVDGRVARCRAPEGDPEFGIPEVASGQRIGRLATRIGEHTYGVTWLTLRGSTPSR